VNATSEAESTAVTPSALATAQARTPEPMPATAASAARRPLSAAVRSTSIVSRPGVTVSTAANAANTRIACTMQRR